MRYVDLLPLALVVLAALVVASIVALAALRSGTASHALRSAGRVLLGGAVLAVLAMTLATGGFGYRSVNLVPGSGIVSSLGNINHSLGMLNLFGNVVMFAPIGFLIVLLGRSMPGATALGAGLSLLIEVTQYVVGRAADVDDVLLNSAGTLVGAVLATVLVGTWPSRWTTTG
ncbi:MAG: VanZ family protein [Nocardioides sp.]|nr:VanZ family protein [Nocardioides sp.]